MLRRLAWLVVLLSLTVAAGGAAFVSCNSDDDPSMSSSGSCAPPSTTAAVAPADEWVGFHVEVPLVPADFDPLASGLFGSDAQAGKFIQGKELSSGITVSSSADPTTPAQTRLTFAFDDGTNPKRVVAVAPASFAVGSVFISTVDAALAKMQADNAAQPGSGESYFLEYRVTSALGGKLSFGVRGNLGVYTLVVDVTSPHTGLKVGTIGKPVDTFAPYDTVAGTVSFHLTKDDFDFFVGHAYGAGATSKQNFDDFELAPHTWLRLTVDPHLTQQFVDVSFDVVTLKNQRIHVSDAPASVLAGSTFQGLVDRNMTTMLAQEAAMVGSSTPWTVPFYYSDPSGGGVVEVIAQGTTGSFSIAYAIESPQNPLKDVPFVAYQPVSITQSDAGVVASCQDLGDPSIKLAPAGTFDITFSASSTILSSPDLKGPLQGTIYCSVYHADDVNIEGPLPGATELQSFTLPNANLQVKPAPTFTTQTFFAGAYQVLCFQDLDGDGNASMGDPVTLPIGSYPMACNKNPISVEFSILDPE
jgi:uncharacterized protein (DUF2141 family)